MPFSSTNTVFGPDGRPIQPPKPPPAPDAATTQYTNDLTTAQGIANNIIGDSTAAHINNPYREQTDEYLQVLRGRLGGMDSEEMRASREEGLAGLSQQTAQSLERYGSIAGANGVQGGARAGLMGRALAEGDRTRASLERNLIMDNMLAKDRAAQAYGGALQGATNTEIGVQTYNAGADDRMTGLRMNLPFQIMSGIGGYRAADAADAASSRQEGIAQQALDRLNQSGGATTPQRNAVDSESQTSIDRLTTTMNDLGAIVGGDVGPDKNKAYKAMNDAAQALRERINLQFGDEPDTEKRRLFEEQWREWLWNAGLINKDGGWRGSGRGIMYTEYHY